MDKLKKVFSPGNKGDDEVLYGSSGPDVPKTKDSGSGPYTQGVPQGDSAPTLYTNPEAEKKNHGVLRQVLNPGGNKYDEQKYGETASTNPALGATTAGGATALHSKPEAEKDGGISRQIFNPDGDKYDETRFGNTANAQKDLPDRSTGNVVPGPKDNSHFGRDAGLSGVGAAGVGAAAYGADRNMSNIGKENMQNPASAERSFPLGGGVATSSVATENNRPTSSIYSDTTGARDTGLGSSSGYTDPNSAASGTSKGYGALDTAAGGAVDHSRTASRENPNPIVPGWEEHGKASHTHTFKGDPCDHETPVPGYIHHARGPHSTDMANRLDPHVPGEFPSEDGMERHFQSRPAGFGAAEVGGGDLDAHKVGSDRNVPSTQPASASASSYPNTSTTDTTVPDTSSSKDHHYGRDAIVAGSAGAAGIGAYQGTKDHHAPTSSQTTSLPDRSLPVTQRVDTGIDGPTDISTIPPSSSGVAGNQSSLEPRKDHHGRDAAIAGGVGAAGLGAYDLAQDRNTPVSSRSAQPESTGYPSTSASSRRADELMGNQIGTSTGAHPSTMSVTPREHIGTDGSIDNSTPATKDHHYGRDAALAGGAGAAGLGAYEATKGQDHTDPASKTTGFHSSNMANTMDPRTQSQPSQTSHQSGPFTTADPRAESDLAKQQQRDHHYGRDAAMAGGAGAAGYGVYEAAKGRDDTGPASKTVGPHSSNVANVVDPRVQPQPEKMKDHTTAGPYQSDTLNRADPRVQSDPAPAQEKEHHYGRDAAVVGGTGAAGYGAYEAIDKHEQEKQVKAEKEHAKEQEKAEKAYTKEQEKLEKQHHKEAEKAEKQHHKEAEKAEKQHQKEQEKLEKAEHQQDEKIAAARAKEQEKLDKAHEKELHKGEHSKLHKDPPEEKEKKPSLIHRILHPHERESDIPAQNISHSAEGDRPKGLDYKDADEARHAQHQRQLAGAGAVGGAGTAGVGASELGSGTHNAGQSHDPNGPSNSFGTGSDGIVTEPHTGLPMNIGKYGTGAGGTDGASQIPGYHETGSSLGQAGEGTHGAADWQGIKKANTPY